MRYRFLVVGAAATLLVFASLSLGSLGGIIEVFIHVLKSKPVSQNDEEAAQENIEMPQKTEHDEHDRLTSEHDNTNERLASAYDEASRCEERQDWHMSTEEVVIGPTGESSDHKKWESETIRPSEETEPEQESGNRKNSGW